MKFYLTLLTIFAFVHGEPRLESQSLQDDFVDILEILPMQKIKKIALQHLHEDPDFQAAVRYMQGEDWKNMTEEFYSQPEVQELALFLKEAGLDAEFLGSSVCSFIRNAKVPDSDHETRSLKNFIEDVKKIMPINALIDIFDEKLNNSPYFQEFYSKVTSDRAHLLVSKVRALPSFKEIAAELNTMGVDVDRILKVVYALFGWNSNKYNF